MHSAVAGDRGGQTRTARSRPVRRRGGGTVALVARLARATLAAMLVLTGVIASADGATSAVDRGDAIDEPLTATPGDPLRGRAIVADRQQGLCLLCHAAPIEPPHMQGDLAPSLAGAGSRSTPGQLRLRLVDSRRLNGQTMMPAYFRTAGLNRVGAAWQGRTLLNAQQIEDVVAYLVTLK